MLKGIMSGKREVADRLKLVCRKFPFAFFPQIFFIQPLIGTCFKAVFRRKSAVTQPANA
ncbi:MAG: hypothetical protein IJK60_01105 [Clostridia bacterium]|nr:hypothetical protein [Clostridia bacterium]